jgi:polyphosphate kinase
MVVRKEGDAIKRYVHLGTGNYNPITAHLYSDIGLFTANDEIGSDITDLFNYLTGYSAKKDYRQLLVAPINMRQRLQDFIQREIDHQNNGKQGHIIFKTNALVDEQIIQLLYRASQAGVKIDLLVRGICCLRPGIPGFSENIRVISVVGRFLEHSRIYFFANDGKPQIFCGSADLMPRNLDRRVEVLFPINDEELAHYVRFDILETYLRDCESAWLMQSDGAYERLAPDPQSGKLSAQQWFMANTAYLSEHHKLK